METLGEPIRITEGYRSIERQNELYAQGRTAPGRIVTNAKGGQSFHNYRVAFDVVFTQKGYNGNWKLFGKTAKELGFVWGGDFRTIKDMPHVELTFGYKIKDFQQGKVPIHIYL